MIIVGITGSMAMGKSTVVKLLKGLGKYPIMDADEEVKKLYCQTRILQKIATLDPCLVRQGKIQRCELTNFVLRDAENILRLEDILYPELAQMRKKFLMKCQRLRMELVFLDIPLLIEKHMQGLCDYVIVVHCPEWLQQKRLKWRQGQSEELKKLLQQQQMTSNEKIKYADFVVQTGLNRHHTMQQLKTMIRILNSHG
jgi:dephospho-CoA kinase